MDWRLETCPGSAAQALEGHGMADQELAALLEPLRRLSARLGADRHLIQGAGGNTSIKRNEKELWVKASGTWLSAAMEKPIFVGLDLRDLRHRLANGEAEPALPACLEPGSTLRPSIEATLHALLPHCVVLHVHSVNAIAFAVRADGRALVAERLAGLRWAWVPYAKPGLPLTRAVQVVMPARPDILLLGNHGLVVGGDNAEAAEALLAEVEQRLCWAPRPSSSADLVALHRLAACSSGRYRPAKLAVAHAAATDPAAARIASQGALYPDHVVFLGVSPQPVMSTREAESALSKNREYFAPTIVLVENLGVLIRSDLGAGAEEMAACLGLVLPRIDPAAPLVFLSAEQEAELLDWDAEKYRQSLNAAS
ncbi:class II aldolase/adducin family protein [Pseudoroseomonas globiformis]|uniref:Class II aldolase/adducin family protein n=1 Tax=Teichococcus globiformis TaxID=2307229 RepID=A0ABV7G3A0_9PROT